MVHQEYLVTLPYGELGFRFLVILIVETETKSSQENKQYG
jgi:hypothetical protein